MKRWQSRTLLADIPLDRPGWSLRVHRIVWLDGSSCIQVMKYATKDGKTTAYHPLQYVQVPVEIAAETIKAMGRAVGE